MPPAEFIAGVMTILRGDPSAAEIVVDSANL
jgi:hypothetical protein